MSYLFDNKWRRGAGALLKTSLGKVVLAIAAVAIVGACVGVPVGIMMGKTATTSSKYHIENQRDIFLFLWEYYLLHSYSK